MGSMASQEGEEADELDTAFAGVERSHGDVRGSLANIGAMRLPQRHTRKYRESYSHLLDRAGQLLNRPCSQGVRVLIFTIRFFNPIHDLFISCVNQQQGCGDMHVCPHGNARDATGSARWRTHHRAGHAHSPHLQYASGRDGRHVHLRRSAEHHRPRVNGRDDRGQTRARMGDLCTHGKYFSRQSARPPC